jgi:hypothetical protein
MTFFKLLFESPRETPAKEWGGVDADLARAEEYLAWRKEYYSEDNVKRRRRNAILGRACTTAFFLGLAYMLWWLNDYPDLVTPFLAWRTSNIAFLDRHAGLVYLVTAICFAAIFLSKLPHAIGWIAGRLARAMREGFEKGLRG